MDLGCPIVHASCADPYVSLLSEDGQVVLLTLREGRGTARLHAQAVNLMFVSIENTIKKICNSRVAIKYVSLLSSQILTDIALCAV